MDIWCTMFYISGSHIFYEPVLMIEFWAQAFPYSVGKCKTGTTWKISRWSASWVMSALRPDADHSCAQSDYNLVSVIGDGDGKIKTSKKVWEAKLQIHIFIVLEYLSYIYKL